MSCEKYKSALIEAAVTGADLTPELRSHVASCASCAAELADQRSLIASIDANLHRQMNAPVPNAMLHRFEAHFARQPQPKRTPRLTQIFAGTLATLAVAAAAILMFLSHWKIDTLEPNAKPIVSSPHSASAGEIQVHIGPSAGPPTTVVARSQTPAQTHTRPVLVSAPVSRHEPEILVPPDEQIALDHFVAHRNARREFVVALATSAHQGFEPSFKGLEIPDINTAEIFIQPIATESRR